MTEQHEEPETEFGRLIAESIPQSQLAEFSAALSGEPDPEPSPEQRRADALRDAHDQLNHEGDQQ